MLWVSLLTGLHFTDCRGNHTLRCHHVAHGITGDREQNDTWGCCFWWWVRVCHNQTHCLALEFIYSATSPIYFSQTCFQTSLRQQSLWMDNWWSLSTHYNHIIMALWLVYQAGKNILYRENMLNIELDIQIKHITDILSKTHIKQWCIFDSIF